MRRAHSTASSIDLTCQIQKPATSSLVSLNGPSTNERPAPLNTIRLPLELGCSPSPASITPAFTSSSLKFIISRKSRSLGILPVSESLLALTKTITFIVGLLFGARNPHSIEATNGTGRDRRRRQVFWAGAGYGKNVTKSR